MKIVMPFNRKVELTAPQLIVIIYIIATTIAATLLALPWATKPGVELSFIDVLFTTVSAITVTGLTVTNTADTFTTFGIVVIALSLQVGGVGIMTLWTFVWVVLGKKIGLGYRQLIMVDQNRNQLMGLVIVIQLVFGFAIIIQALGFAWFATIFYNRGYYDSLGESLYYAAFHAISAYTNGGFDIFGNSLMGFQSDYMLQFGTMLLIVFGAIGFPVMIEVLSWLHSRIYNYNFKFSLFSKITISIFFLLLLFGFAGVFVLEYSGILADKDWHDKIFTAMFLSVTARSGGLTTIDVTHLFVPSLLFVSILMFIGASPSSVGGGIRTTTFATLILALRSYSLGKNNIHIFGKRLSNDDVMKSFIVFSTAVIMIVTAVLIINIFETDKIPLIYILFEVTSAFGTCGLSTGILADFTAVSKIVLMALMFIGRIGLLSFLETARKSGEGDHYKYPEEKIIIG